MQSVEQQLSEAKATIVNLTKENKDLKEAIAPLTEAVKTANKATAKAHLSQLIAEAGFPEKSVKLVTARLEKEFENAEKTDSMKESVAREADYLKSVGAIVTPKVERKNGAANVQESEKLDESNRVKRTMKEMRMNEKEARIFLGLD